MCRTTLEYVYEFLNNASSEIWYRFIRKLFSVLSDANMMLLLIVKNLI